MSKGLAVLLLVCGAGLAVATAAQENTPPKELIQYVRDARKAGLNEEQIQQNAGKAGWPAESVTQAITAVNAPAEAKPPAGEPVGKNSAGSPWSSLAGPSSPEKMAQPSASAAANPPAEKKSLLDAPPQPVGGVAPTASRGAAPSGVPANGAPDPSVKPSQPVNRGVPDDYQIGPGDVLHVNVWGEPTASVNGAVVRTDGKISMPLIHEIAVLGMTTGMAEKAIAEQLGKYLTSPDVAVIVAGINSKKIYVTGQVKKEGTIPYTYRMTIMQALSEAGGLSPYAKKKKIYVLRNEDGRSYNLPFDYDAVLQGKHMEMNIPLKPGDQLIVP